MEVTAKMIKELREHSGAGMLDCKKALVDSDGDMKKAEILLRERGLSAAAKKADRIAAEGLVDTILTEDGNIGAIVEINSETDFVAKNVDFQKYVKQVVTQVSKSVAKNVEEFLAEKWIGDESETVDIALKSKIAIIGENLKIRRFGKIIKSENGLISTYIHAGGKVGVLLYLTTEKVTPEVEEAGKNLAMQIAAMSPKYVSRDDVSEDFIASEKEILKQQALNDEANAGRPENILEKIIEGRLSKLLREVCLDDQFYVKDDSGKQTVNQYLKEVGKVTGAPITIKEFIRFETGEGLEKKEEDFAAEVNKAME